MIKVSVIIPVYNSEKFLPECIACLLAQTQPDCEFIFINDGSTDNSRVLIEAFQLKDNRVTLIFQQNQGVSAARNAGIATAKGEYLGFYDADDRIEKDMYQKLYATASANNSDIVISNFYAEQTGSILFVTYPFLANKPLDKKYITANILPYFVEKDMLNSACTKIYKTALIKNNNITFPVGVALGEDGVFNMKAFNHANTAIYTEYAGYHYIEIEGSATRNTAAKDYFAKVLEAYNYDYKSIIDLELSSTEYEKLRSMRLVNSALSLLHLYFYSSAVSLTQRFTQVKTMLSNPQLQTAIQGHYLELSNTKSRYERFLLEAVANKSLIKIYLATMYSKMRNK